jgi:hypothetical protein
MKRQYALKPKTPSGQILTRDGHLLVNYISGSIRHINYQHQDPGAFPIYDPTETAPEWESTIRLCLGLSEDPQRMYNHFHDLLGWMICPTRIVECNVILYGEFNSGAHDVLHVINKLISDPARVGRSLHITDERLKVEQVEKMRNPLFIPFMRNIEKHIRLYTWDSIYQNELPGVLNLCIDGLQRLIRRKGFSQPAECVTVMERWCETSPVKNIARFAKEKLTKVDFDFKPTKGTAIYKKYVEWLSGATAFIKGRFYRELEKLNFVRVMINNNVYFKLIII